MLQADEPTFEPTDMLSYYVECYESTTPTELVDQAQVRNPFKRSNAVEQSVRQRGRMGLVMDPRTYRMRFVGEEMLVAVGGGGGGGVRVEETEDGRVQAFEKWLERRRSELD